MAAGLWLSASVEAGERTWYRQLCGLWRTQASSGGYLYEHWWFEDGALLGRAWRSKNGQQRERERLRLVDLTQVSRYLATPTGAATTAFHAVTDADPDARRWHNVEHDFPQVVRYRLRGDELEARVTQLDDEMLDQGLVWRFRRLQSCTEED